MAKRIDLYGYVGEEVTASRLVEEMKGETEIDIHVFSGGGSLFEAAAIYGILKQHPHMVTTYIEGLAASAAAYFPMASDKVVMDSDAMLMVHNAWTMAVGNKNDLREQADKIEKQQQQMIRAFVEKTGLTEEEVQELLDDETWMNAEEAVAWGFADEVFEAESRVAASVDERIVNEFGFKNIPDAVTVNRNSNKNKNNTMNEELIKALSLPKSADASAAVQAVNDLTARIDSLESTVQEKTDLVASLNDKLENKNSRIEELETVAQSVEVSKVVSTVLEVANVALAEENLEALRRRAERYTAEEDEELKADMREDMIIFANAKGVEAGKSDGIDTSAESRNTGGNHEPKTYEEKLKARVDAKIEKNPDMSYMDAVREAKSDIKAEARAKANK